MSDSDFDEVFYHNVFTFMSDKKKEASHDLPLHYKD